MSARWQMWWRARTRREQRLMLVMFALLAITIIWAGIYRPLTDGLSSSRERYAHALVASSRTRAEADAARAIARLPAPAGAVAGIVSQAADQAGFTGATVSPQGDRRAALAIPSVRPPVFFAWIAGLEARGIFVERLSAKANSDATLAVDATLAGRAR